MGAIVAHILGRKKTQTEIESLIVGQYKDLLDSTRSEVADLRERMNRYSKREEQLLEDIIVLKAENKQLRIEVDKLTNNTQ